MFLMVCIRYIHASCMQGMYDWLHFTCKACLWEPYIDDYGSMQCHHDVWHCHELKPSSTVAIEDVFLDWCILLLYTCTTWIHEWLRVLKILHEHGLLILIPNGCIWHHYDYGHCNTNQSCWMRWCFWAICIQYIHEFMYTIHTKVLSI